MKFHINTSEQLEVRDQELTELLYSVYVDEGYTPESVASVVFKPSSVRARGEMFLAREKSSNQLAGIVILVPGSSPARVLANSNECEMHLLAVRQEYRGFKLGGRLVQRALDLASEGSWTKIKLWTQTSMVSAQKLYLTKGFIEVGKMRKRGVDFVIFEKCCHTMSVKAHGD